MYICMLQHRPVEYSLCPSGSRNCFNARHHRFCICCRCATSFLSLITISCILTPVVTSRLARLQYVNNRDIPTFQNMLIDVIPQYLVLHFAQIMFSFYAQLSFTVYMMSPSMIWRLEHSKFLQLSAINTRFVTPCAIVK